MKKFTVILLSLSLILPFTIKASAISSLDVSAQSAVLMECSSKEIVFDKNSEKRLPMASTTKIMTALVILEKFGLQHKFTVNESAVGTEGTSAYLKKGDTLTIESALYALLLQSANDAANALALEACESIEAFSVLMNEKAKEIGLSDTQFKNPSGLPEEGHYTTAHDLAFLGSVCLENSDFYKIVSTKAKTVEISGEKRTFVNHNKLLSSYDGAIGIKTGFTKESGRCLVSAAERNGVRFVCVTLSASNDWNDHKILLDHGFSQYKSFDLYYDEEFLIEVPTGEKGKTALLSAKGSKSVSLHSGSRISVKIEAPHILFKPINKGKTVGYAVFTSNGKEIHRTPLVLLSSIE